MKDTELPSKFYGKCAGESSNNLTPMVVLDEEQGKIGSLRRTIVRKILRTVVQAKYD